jgi:hypothetical protein
VEALEALGKKVPEAILNEITYQLSDIAVFCTFQGKPCSMEKYKNSHFN